uniref:Ribosomal protein L6 n=1 Tax=Kumanoa americana TaxID=1196377 RepID=A0A1C9CGU2_9FLOR|nr:ribosomal protein L6 [Kumanoa americana]AOM67618.1 ribosomal protein L6 [Kumanoa americana]
MSRIGKQTIILPNPVNIDIKNNIVTIQGPKGQQSRNISPLIDLAIQQLNDQKLLCLTIKDKSKQSQSLYGLSRTLIDNMIIGVTEGFSKHLEIQGVGYRSQMDGNKLILNVGYSHPVIITPPKDIFIQVENNTNISIFGINKEIVGQLASTIRAIRPPEPYKGKGIRYKGEIVKKKVGKAGK